MSVKKDINLKGIDLTVKEKYESGSSIGGGYIISKDGNNQIRLNPNNLCIETTKNGTDNNPTWEPCGKNDYYNTTSKKGEIFNDYTNNKASDNYSHCEGWHSGTITYNGNTYNNDVLGNYLYCEGQNNCVYSNNSHA